MDSKELRGLVEAYSEVYAPQEELDEAVKGASRHDTEMRKAASSERRGGDRPLSKKVGDANAAHMARKVRFADKVTKAKGHMPGYTYGEEVDVFDTVLEFLQAEGYAETLEEAEWLMANVIDEEAIGIILGEAITSEKGKAKAAEMIAARSTPSGRAKPGQGASVAAIKHISRANVENLSGTPATPTIAKNPVKSRSYGGTGNAAARRAAALRQEEFVDEAQEARNNPEKYERKQDEKYAPVRGERTPMPPRGDRRREDFEKWYAANVR